MNATDQMVKDAENGIKIAEANIETAQGLYQDAHDEGNVIAISQAKEAIDFASLAVTSYHESIVQGKDEDRLASLDRGFDQLRRCEQSLTEAKASMKAIGNVL